MHMIAAAGSSGRSYSKPKAAKPAATAAKAKRRPVPDHAIREASRTYYGSIEADAALDRLPPALGGSVENQRREREGARIIGKRDGALEAAAALPAETAAGVLMKAEMLGDVLERTRGFMMDDKDGAWQLAASLAADVRRTAAPLTLAGLLAAEDASPDAELIELCAAWPAAVKAANAEMVDDGPASRAFDALEARIAAQKPCTLAGLLAVARQAKAEAIDKDGEERPEHTGAADIAWGLLNDLLRLTGESA
jgi:hypothetical protein